jgi:hypothetical protein
MEMEIYESVRRRPCIDRGRKLAKGRTWIRQVAAQRHGGQRIFSSSFFGRGESLFKGNFFLKKERCTVRRLLIRETIHGPV